MKKCIFLLSFFFFIAVNVFCQNADQYYERALVKGGDEDYKGALEDLNKAISLAPKESNFYYVRGTLKSKLLQLQGALADLNKAIQLDPNNGNALQNRAVLKLKLKDYKGVLADCTQALKVDATLFESYIARGNAKGMLNDYKGAIMDYTEVIIMAPNSPMVSTAFLMRGSGRIMIGQKETGCKDLRQAAKLGLEAANEMIKQFCN